MSKVGSKNYLKNNGFVMMVSSIMASDSPTSDYKDAFTYPPPGRSTPPPTTSSNHLPAKQESHTIEPDAGTTNASSKPEKDDNLKEHQEKDKDKDELDMSSPDANPGYKPPDHTESKSEKRDDYKDDKSGAKMNGGDKLDAQFMLPLDAKDKDDEREEESCTVNCLYYTMQCCECTIT